MYILKTKTGCNGNQNNFEGIEECQKTCSNQISI
jgi:hypothetical protein